jgi:hypothetical protein
LHKSINLLRFSSEFQGREADYARLLFRALMPRLFPTCFVLDNLQQPDVGWLWDVLGVLVEELHPSSLVFRQPDFTAGAFQRSAGQAHTFHTPRRSCASAWMKRRP